MAPTAEDVVVVPMTEQDWPQVERIYSAGIEAGHATFESTVPTWDQFDGSRLVDHRLVAVAPDGTVVGWAACVGVSARPVHAGVVELYESHAGGDTLLLAGTGFCGTFTTFSTFMFETIRLVADGLARVACANLAVSVLGGVGAAPLGVRGRLFVVKAGELPT